MGKNKTTKNEKKAAEFILTARPADDPDYNNPNVPQNVLLYVPKDRDDESTQKTLDQIPEIMRGNTFDEETQAKLIKQKLGIEENDNFESSIISEKKSKISNNKSGKIPKNNEKIPKLFNEETGKELSEEDENMNDMDLDDDEEIINTNINTNNKISKKDNAEKESKAKNNIANNNNNKKIGFKKDEKKEFENLTLKDLLSGNKEKLLDIDDKTLDLLIKKSKAKIDAELIQYNEYGLKGNVDPEVLEYVTDKKFREGVDIFIPAPNYDEIIEQNRVDIDINPEEMNPDYKEVYEALNKTQSENENNDNSILEDDFILLANEGKLPIELLEEDAKLNKDEIVLVETEKKDPNKPSYKFITKEEKEFLDKQFNKTYNVYYKDEENDENENNKKKLNKIPAAVEEEEFEEYELSEEENLNNKNNKKIVKTDLKSKEFNDAINELLPKHKRVNYVEKNKKSNKDQEEEEEEDEEYEDEEEEFEEFDENLLDDEYIRKQQELGEMESTIKYSENLILQEKGVTAPKIYDKKNLVLKTKKKIEDEETIEEMEKYLYSKEVLEMDLKVINNQLLRDEINEEADKAKEDNDPAYDLNYAKKYLDITAVAGTFGNMPKVVSIEGDPKKLEKKLKREEKIKKEKEAKMLVKNQEDKKTSNVKNQKEKNEEFDFNKEIKNQQITKIKNEGKDSIGKELKEKLDNLDDSDIEQNDEDKDEINLNDEHKFEGMSEKEANKLRKKMLKEEKREKRKLKKEIKLAFKDEKNKQSKQIANTNTVIRYGISVKEI